LYTIKMDGTHLRRLTPFTLNVGTRIDWAPSGRHIVFTQYKNGGPGNTALIRPDGTGLVFVTHYDGDVGAGGAVYSPNGRWILYRRQNNVVGRYSMWKMHPDGSDRIRIRGMGVNFCCLDWGPQPR
jgi:Tol biopolymer transport system component